jgi:hypothetical protein
MDLRETGCEDGRWMELTQDRVQWQALVMAVLILRVLLPDNWLTMTNIAADLNSKWYCKQHKNEGDKFVEYSDLGLLNFCETKCIKSYNRIPLS